MRVIQSIVLSITFVTAAHADFSYKTTSKMGGIATMASQQVSTYYFKGQNMKTESGTIATVLDLEAQTITTINNSARTYTVRNFSELAGTADAGVDARIDVKETGQKKMVNGFMATEIIMTMEVDSLQASPMGKIQMEMDLWISPDVPGSAEVNEFYQRNAARFQRGATSTGSNAGMQKARADLQRKMFSIHGVQVESVERVKSDGMSQIPGALFEATSDSSDFSTAAIPDSVFAIPTGYQKGN